MKWFFAGLVTLTLLWVFWPLLALTTANRAMLQGQETDAPRLYAAAPRTLLVPQKISGPPGKLDGRYLTRSLPQGLDGWLRGHGYTFENQMGEGRSYHWENGRVETICRRFSAGFEVCSLTTWEGQA